MIGEAGMPSGATTARYSLRSCSVLSELSMIDGEVPEAAAG